MGADAAIPAVAPASDPAPVASPASTPAATPEPVVSGASPSGSTPSESIFPAPDAFGWDTWDGTHTSLPEPVRGWGEKLASHYGKANEDVRAELDFQRNTYEQLIAGNADPRVAKLQADLDARLKEIEGFTGTRSELEKKVQEAEAKIVQFETAWKSYQETEAKTIADKFAAEHPYFFDDGDMQKLGNELLDEGFGLDELPVLARLPEPVLARARALRKEFDGAQDPGAKAIQVARTEARLPRTQAADLVAGGSRVAASPTDLSPKTAGSEDERLRLVVNDTLRQQKRA